MKLRKGYGFKDTWGAEVTWMGDCPKWAKEMREGPVAKGHSVEVQVRILSQGPLPCSSCALGFH